MAHSIGHHILKASKRISLATGISQDNIIFAAVMFAFIVWITSKGELPTYIKFFTPGARTGPLDPTKDKVVATPSTGEAVTNYQARHYGTQQSPNGGGTIVNSPIPGVPGVNLKNPFAGIPLIGGGFQWLQGIFGK